MEMDLQNFTLTNSSGENDIDEDLDAYIYEWPWHRTMFHYLFIFTEIIIFIIYVLSLVTNIYLIVVIKKFPNLQNRINNLVLQYAILNILYLLLANVLLIIIEISGSVRFYFSGYCFVSTLDHLFLTLGFYVLTFMALDWYISNYRTNIYERYPQSFKYGNYFLYLFALPKWVTSSTSCFIERYHTYIIRINLELVSFLMCLFTIIFISVLIRRKTLTLEAQKTEYALIIPRTVILLSLPYFVIREITEFLPHKQYGFIFYEFTLVVLGLVKILFVVTPIIVLYQLTKLNKNFKSAYLKSCKKRWVKSYADEDIDADSIHEESPNNVTYDRNSAVINF